MRYIVQFNIINVFLIKYNQVVASFIRYVAACAKTSKNDPVPMTLDL